MVLGGSHEPSASTGTRLFIFGSYATTSSSVRKREALAAGHERLYSTVSTLPSVKFRQPLDRCGGVRLWLCHGALSDVVPQCAVQLLLHGRRRRWSVDYRQLCQRRAAGGRLHRVALASIQRQLNKVATLRQPEGHIAAHHHSKAEKGHIGPVPHRRLVDEQHCRADHVVGARSGTGWTS